MYKWFEVLAFSLAAIVLVLGVILIEGWYFVGGTP